MSRKSEGLSDELHAYLVAHGVSEDDVLRDLVAETEQALSDDADMQIAPEQGAFLTLLARLTKARFAVEVGTFTGYSSICLARGLPEGGRLVCFDSSEEYTAIARRYWERAGLSDRIELRLGDAADTLPTLADDPPIDLAFIDADKPGYPRYYEAVLARLAPDGLIVVDNVFGMGKILEPTNEEVEAVAAFNTAVAKDDRVDVVMLPVADGVSLITRRDG